MKYKLIGFYEESSRKVDPIREFSALPEPAYYIDDPVDFIFDYRKTSNISFKYKHILDDRLERWMDILRELTVDMLEPWLRSLIYDSLKRLRRNYKLAIPQYFQGEIQLLIPVCTRIDIDKYRATCALPLRRVSNSYVAQTFLSLDMAYKNARLITKPDPEAE